MRWDPPGLQYERVCDDVFGARDSYKTPAADRIANAKESENRRAWNPAKDSPGNQNRNTVFNTIPRGVISLTHADGEGGSLTPTTDDEDESEVYDCIQTFLHGDNIDRCNECGTVLAAVPQKGQLWCPECGELREVDDE